MRSKRVYIRGGIASTAEQQRGNGMEEKEMVELGLGGAQRS